MQYATYKWIGIRYAEPFPMFTKSTDTKDTTNAGPFYAANSVLSWHADTPKNRAWLQQSVEHWIARGFTPTIAEMTTKQRR